MHESRIEELFHEAMSLPPEERERFLDEACGVGTPMRAQVESLLLAHEEAGDFLANPSVAVSDQPGSDHSDGRATPGMIDEQPGTVIGPYTLVERLGEGGFGVVYLAEQHAPIRRQVALKILKHGMDTGEVLARFEAERQALARMDHPGIARVLDAGSTEQGRPYFVMDLVRGVPITEFCQQHDLPLRDRLALFGQVCSAVQHAHQKGVIHRDIKPANVLVTHQDGRAVPTVIDFGIAKAVSGRLTERTLLTRGFAMLGTPEYMSPEQAHGHDGDIDTRTDVYALGVLLYELLTGSIPFDAEALKRAGYGEIQRIIREVEPPKPSTRLLSGHGTTTLSESSASETKRLVAMVRGDLDWVVMKAMEKDRARRYETVNALAMDVQRHLDHEPVLAGPPSRWYRAQKFVRRNRTGVVTASLVAAALVLGTIGTGMGLARAIREADRADREAERALAAEAEAETRADNLEVVAAFQERLLSRLNPQQFGEVTRRQILEQRRLDLESSTPDPERLEAQLAEFEALLAGVNFTNAAVETLDRHILRPAMETVHEEFDDQPLVKARLLQTVANTMRRLHTGDLALTESALREALDIRRQHLGEGHRDTLTILDEIADLYHTLGRLTEAEVYWTKYLEYAQREFGPLDSTTNAAVNNLGFLFSETGQYAKAEEYYRKALDDGRQLFGDDDARTLTMLNNVGYILLAQGDLQGAEPYYREALDGRRRLLGENHKDTLDSMNNMGYLLQQMGRYEKAEAYYRETLERCRQVFGDRHPDTLETIDNLSGVLRAQGRLDEAEPYYREALASRKAVLGERHPQTLTSMNNMGVFYHSRGDLAKAEPYYRRAIEHRREVLGDEHPHTLKSILEMGKMFILRGDPAEAEPYIREAKKGFRRVLGDEHTETLDSIANLGVLLFRLGRYAEAEPYFMEVLETRRRVLGSDDMETINSMANLGAALSRQGKHAEALPYFREVLEYRRRALGDAHPQTLSVLTLLATSLVEAEHFDEAESLAVDRMERSLALHDRDHPEVRSAAEFLADLYDAWHRHDPDAGHDEEAERWQAKSEHGAPDREDTSADGRG